MKRPELKKQIALPLVAAVVFGLIFYFLYQFRMPEPPAGSADELRMSFMAQEWTRNLISALFFISLALIVVRALNEFIFFVFRKRKGYEAPSLMRDIFSLVAYVTSIALILKYFFPNFSFGALLSGSALLGIILG
ncbi:MAG: hypothetical protein LC802_05395, partial [Acidobacteria bacterium]|nr:hypothetical protein [Acidobacteriota bacterium]